MPAENLDHYNDIIRPGDTVTIIGESRVTHWFPSSTLTRTVDGLLVESGTCLFSDYYRDRARVLLNLAPNSEKGFYVERDYYLSDLVRR